MHGATGSAHLGVSPLFGHKFYMAAEKRDSRYFGIPFWHSVHTIG